jgi:hypothetical protein
MSVGVMKDSKLKLRNLHDSDTLGYTGSTTKQTRKTWLFIMNQQSER